MLRLNQPAPPIALRNQFGIPTSLQELRGHIVVMWWHRTIGVVSAEVIAKALRDRHADFTMHNAAIICISGDTAADNRRFQERLNLPFDLLSDSDPSIGTAYGTTDWWRANPELPFTLVLDATGTIRAIRQLSRTTAVADTLLNDVVQAAVWT